MLVLAAAGAVGCGLPPGDEEAGGDDGAPATTSAPAAKLPVCQFTGGLSGAVEQTMLWEKPRCSSTVSESSPHDLVLQFAKPNELMFELTISKPTPTAVTTAAPATVGVRASSGNRWKTPAGACTVEIKLTFARHTALGNLYDLSGTGRCLAPAAPDAAHQSGPAPSALGIADFAFSATPLL